MNKEVCIMFEIWNEIYKCRTHKVCFLFYVYAKFQNMMQ